MKKSNIFFNAVIIISTMVSITGCGVFKGAVIQTAKPIMKDQIVSMNNEPDIELAKTALPSNIKLIEGLAVSYPDDIDLKLWLCEAVCGYSLGFVEDTDRQRASSLYLRARDYAVSAAVKSAGFKKEFLNDPDKLKKWADKIGKNNIAVLFWIGQSWGSWMAINLDKPDALADLAKVQLIMDRVIALNPEFYHSGAHIFLGSVYASLPSMFGGNLNKSKDHFDKCFQATKGNFLLAKTYFMKTYCVKTMDKQLFIKTLKEVEGFNIDSEPSSKLTNAIAKSKAEKLKNNMEELFPDED